MSPGGSFAGTIAADYEYYEVPDPSRVAFPPLVFHRIIESRQAYLAGENVYTVPREGTLWRLAHQVQANDVFDTTADNFRLVFNKSDEVYRVPKSAMKSDWNERYGRTWQPGAYIWDLWSAEGQPAEGDNRDMISSEALSTLESIFTTTTPVAGTLNAVDTIREFSQVLSM